ncbi:MAG TPA: hypothetical protein DEH78_24420 [Solibacterales bacterium]|nr:hypothetical protein [Bryobacterales bacterium]
MAVLRPRNRLVYFRLSEDEFEKINSACHATGARSISDLARHALQKMIEEQRPSADDSPLAIRLRTMDDMIRTLNQNLEQLTGLIGSLRTPGNGEPETGDNGNKQVNHAEPR